jgi:isoamyl acetate esterase
MRQQAYRLLFTLALGVSGCANYGMEHTGRIVFFGDSITQMADQSEGYLTLLRAFASSSGRSVDIVNAGISGNKVTDLRNRLQRDVIEKAPTTVVIYIGINDVWHWQLPGLKGTPPDTFRTVLTDIVHQLRSRSIQVILCTPSVIGERKGGMNPQDALLDDYSEMTRTVARECKVPLCDLRKSFLRSLEEKNAADVDRGILTADRVHLNAAGNRLVEREFIAALGWDRPNADTRK